MEDIREVHKRIHRFVGIYVIGIPTFFHIWTIFIPFFAGLELGIFTKRPQVRASSAVPRARGGGPLQIVTMFRASVVVKSHISLKILLEVTEVSNWRSC